MTTAKPIKGIDQPLANGTKVEVLEYVMAGRVGRIIGRTDTDSPESYRWFVYEVVVDGCGRQYLTQFEIRSMA